jgi:membrane protease YdiL (CAAX protease family)
MSTPFLSDTKTISFGSFAYNTFILALVLCVLWILNVSAFSWLRPDSGIVAVQSKANVGLLLLSPLWEEWLFRGCLLPTLTHRWALPIGGAIVLQALLFGALHSLQLETIGFWWPFTAGVILGLNAQHRQSWGTGALAHLLLNIISVYGIWAR